MRCSLHRVTALVWAPLITAAFIWGCAQSATGDITPETDPSLPELDASWTPSPDKPKEKTDAGKDSGGESTVNPPAKITAEAGAPPPPPPPAGPPKPTQGEVYITEVMYDPFANEPASEWIELHNASSGGRTLSGLTIVDGGNRTHVIGAGVTIASGAYVVLARLKTAVMSAKVPAASIVYEYGAGLPDNGGIQLANAATGGVYLRDGAATIAQADYGGWYSQSGGSSIQLKTLTYTASGQSSSWCLSLNAWTTGSDKGTPGAANDCP